LSWSEQTVELSSSLLLVQSSSKYPGSYGGLSIHRHPTLDSTEYLGSGLGSVVQAEDGKPCLTGLKTNRKRRPRDLLLLSTTTLKGPLSPK